MSSTTLTNQTTADHITTNNIICPATSTEADSSIGTEAASETASSIPVNSGNDDDEKCPKPINDQFQTIRDIYLNEKVDPLIAREFYFVDVSLDGSVGMYILTATPTKHFNDHINTPHTRILAVVPTLLTTRLADHTYQVEEVLNHGTLPTELSERARSLVSGCLTRILSDLGSDASKSGAPVQAKEHAYMIILLRPDEDDGAQGGMNSHHIRITISARDPRELIREMRGVVNNPLMFNGMWNT